MLFTTNMDFFKGENTLSFLDITGNHDQSAEPWPPLVLGSSPLRCHQGAPPTTRILHHLPAALQEEAGPSWNHCVQVRFIHFQWRWSTAAWGLHLFEICSTLTETHSALLMKPNHGTNCSTELKFNLVLVPDRSVFFQLWPPVSPAVPAAEGLWEGCRFRGAAAVEMS